MKQVGMLIGGLVQVFFFRLFNVSTKLKLHIFITQLAATVYELLGILELFFNFSQNYLRFLIMAIYSRN